MLNLEKLKNKKLSLYDLLMVFIFILVILYFILSYNYVINMQEQILNLNIQIDNLSKTIDLLKDEIHLKNDKIERLFLNNSIASLNTGNDILKTRNEMIQFYIKTAGVLLVGTALFVFVFPGITAGFKSFMTLKYWVPTQTYALLQSKLSFLNEVKDFLYEDRVNGIFWCVKVVNGEYVKISGKFIADSDYLNVEEFAALLLTRNNNIINTVGETALSVLNNPTTIDMSLNSVELLSTFQASEQLIRYL